MDSGEAVDRECTGGLRIYAVPVFCHREAIGVINFGHGIPPTDPNELKELSSNYQIDPDTLRQRAEAYKPRPPFIIETAKRRLNSIARMIGEIVEHKQAEEEREAGNKELQKFNKFAVGRELRMIELKTEINALCRELGRDEPYA